MTLEEGVATVQRILKTPFPPGYRCAPERCAPFVAEDGHLQGMTGLEVWADEAMYGVNDDGEAWETPAVITVYVRVQAAPQQQYAYFLPLDDLAEQDEESVRAGWLFSLVRAVAREGRV